MKEKIEKILQGAIHQLYDNSHGREEHAIEILIEVPKEKTYGDYATSVALVLAKKLGKNPVEVAREIISKIGKQKFIEKIEVAGSGFINFYLSQDFFIEKVKEILKNKKAKGSEHGRRIIVEYTDPNILKEFHIGHLMSNAIGESISRIFEFQGAKVKRANYQGDVGLHVAKALWGKSKNPNMTWAQAYAFGSTKYEEDGVAKQEIIELNKKIFEKSDTSVNQLYAQGRKESLVYFEKIYKKLGTHFDRLFFESEVAETGKKIVEGGLKKGIFEPGERGAIVFKGETVGLHTRVFINSEGLPTYEAKDLALPELKYQYFKYDTSVIITAHEQNAYFDVMLAALKELQPQLQEKTKHIGHGMMRLPEGKMSSRTGKVVTAESLIEKVKEMVREKAANKVLDDATIEIIAIGALKYSILKQSIGSDIIFDFEKSISFEGDSGPYLQYSYVRAISVLAKAKVEKVKASLKKVPTEITQLEKMMSRFPEVIVPAAGGIPSEGGKKAGAEYEPHVITLYLTELAREFNNYYAHHKIVDKEDEFSPYRVGLAKAFSIIIKNGLWLLGIQAPIKM